MSVHGLKRLIIVTILICAFELLSALGDDDSSEEEAGRQIREFMPEAWHAVQTIPEGTNGWIPRDPADGQTGVGTTKRRRLRKRKRRPPIISYLDPSADNVQPGIYEVREEQNQDKEESSLSLSNTRYGNTEYTVAKRRKRPNTGDPWEELQEESIRPYVRRKVTPAYQTTDDLTIITKSDSNHNPLSATIQFGSESTSNIETPAADDKNSGNPFYGNPTVKQTDRVDTENGQFSFIQSSTTTKRTPNIKEIIKQNGGLSLSEILQKKNITLSELLMGKKEAIKALAEPSAFQPVASTTTPRSQWENRKTTTTQKNRILDNSDTTKYKRLPPSLRKNTIHRRYEQYTDEALSDKEMMEAQRKRLALLQGTNYKNPQNEKFSEVTRYEVITEPTTEKRIFVPSHPQLYTSVDYKPDFEDLAADTEAYFKLETPKPDTTTQPSTTTTQNTEPTSKYTKTSKPGFTKSKSRLPLTSAKLMKMTTKKVTTPAKVVSTMETVVAEEENYPKLPGLMLKPYKINVKDILGFQSSENQSEEKVAPDEPLRMSIDLDAVVESSTPKATSEHLTAVTFASSTKPSEPPIPEAPKLKPFSAKDEILEILKDPVGRARLARILEARNMTIQELIEQRERGSSQLHLADIFHNQTREPEPLDEALEGKISSEVFTSFPVFVRQPKSLLKESTSQKPVISTTQDSKLSVTAFPSFKIEVNKQNLQANETFPWQRLYPDVFQNHDQNSNEKADPIVIEQVMTQRPPEDILTEEYLQRLENLDQRFYSSASSEGLNIVNEAPQKIHNASSGVKSAIIASLAIVVMSMMVFITIMFVFKWTQKRRKRLDYGDSLKPSLLNVKSRNIKTFVAETLGKKKVNYYKRHLQTLSDEVWERENERKNAF